MSIHPQAAIGYVHLKIASMRRSLDFYTQILGFRVLQQGEDEATLSADGSTTLLKLTELPGAAPQPRNATGLYHFAILVPDRISLARSIMQLAEMNYPLGGASDHLVSEALYLSDPDENGIEIYRDRPRSEWNWRNEQVEMAVDPLDYRGLLAELETDTESWKGLPPQTRIGHMHLQVGTIQQAEDFYHGILGFDVVAKMRGALFVSAGGYHHHIGLNTWHSAGGQPSPAENAGLRAFSITLPDMSALAEVESRLQQADVPYEQQDEKVVSFDPWRNRIVFSPQQ